MSLLRHAVPFAALVLVVGACQSTPAASPSVAPPASSAPTSAAAPATGAAPTAAAPTTTTASPEALGGTWTLVLSNPHVIAATGSHVGGTVVIEGNRSVFTAGEYSSSTPIEISGMKALDCNATRCSIEGVPLYIVRVVDGQLAIVHAAMLTPLGTFGEGSCAWEDVPDGGIVTVVSTGMVAGQEVPTVVTFADGTASGVGTNCDMGSHSVAWDVTATRQ